MPQETKPSGLGPRLARHFVGATVGWKSYAPMPSSVRHQRRRPPLQFVVARYLLQEKMSLADLVPD